MNRVFDMSEFNSQEEYILKVGRNYEIVFFDEALSNIIPDIKSGDKFYDAVKISYDDCSRIFSENDIYTKNVISYNDNIYNIKAVKSVENDETVYIVFMSLVNSCSCKNSCGECSENCEMKVAAEKNIVERLPVFYAKYKVTDRIEFIEASKKFYEFYGTSKNDYRLDSFFNANNFTKEAIDNLVEIGKRHEPVSFILETYKNTENEDRIIYQKIQASFWEEVDSVPVYIAIFSDITEHKELEKQLIYEKERYRVALQSTNDTLYEYNIKTDTFVAYGKLNNYDKERIVSKNFYERLHDINLVYKDDVEKVRSFLKEYAANPIEVRYIYEGEPVWVSVSGSVVYDSLNRPGNIIGRIKDINEEKLKEIKALENSYKDKLTGLLKKTRGEQLIKNYLAEKKDDVVCSAFIIDLDNFGELNNNYSFLFGDTVLQEAAAIFKEEFSEISIITRIGGDEFLVFSPNTDRIEAEKTADKICRRISNLYTGENDNITLTCSIGIVSSDIVDYDEIMNCVERAAVYVKQNDKNGYMSYSDLPDKERNKMARMLSIEREMLTSESIYSERDDSIIEFTFDLLEKTRDLKSAIKLLLNRIGKFYDFDRISIIEIDTDFLVCSASYSWDSIGHNSVTGEIVNVSEREIESLQKNLTGDGVYVLYKNSCEYKNTFISRLYADNDNKNHAMFIRAMYEEGNLKGLCVYEDFHDSRILDRRTRVDICEITKIISTHISRDNADAASNVKSEFLSRVSHNIRTPMNAITGMTEIARNFIDDKEKTMNCLDKIETSTKYLISLINEILDMSNIESGKFKINNEPFDLDDIVKVISTVTEEKADKEGIEFHLFMNYKEQYLIGDGVRLNQVLINIINNAVRYTESGGRVDLKIHQIDKKYDEVTLRFDITDTGVGISGEELRKMFKMFEQSEKSVSNNESGLGVGLAITSNIIKLMGGRLQVESKLGKGSNFYFVLKFKVAPEDKIVQKNIKKEEYNFKGKRILLVEDDDLNAEIAQTILEMAGFDVERAEDGQIAVNMFKERPDEYYSAVLMDIRMPRMNGLEATRCIRVMDKSDARTIPIIALTAEAFTQDEQHTLENGMNAHLLKPINVKMLYSVLNSLIIK